MKNISVILCLILVVFTAGCAGCSKSSSHRFSQEQNPFNQPLTEVEVDGFGGKDTLQVYDFMTSDIIVVEEMNFFGQYIKPVPFTFALTKDSTIMCYFSSPSMLGTSYTSFSIKNELRVDDQVVGFEAKNENGETIDVVSKDQCILKIDDDKRLIVYKNESDKIQKTVSRWLYFINDKSKQKAKRGRHPKIPRNEKG